MRTRFTLLLALFAMLWTTTALAQGRVRLRQNASDAFDNLEAGSPGACNDGLHNDGERVGDRVRARLNAWATGLSGELDASEEMFTRLLTLERTSPGSPFREIFLRWYLADVLVWNGRPEEAIVQVRAALDTYDGHAFPNDPDRLWARAIEATALADLARYAEAELALDEAVQIESLFPEHRLHLPAVLWARAKVARGRKLDDEARTLGEQAAARAGAIYGRDHPLTRRIRAWIDES